MKSPSITSLLRLGSKRKGVYQAKDKGGFTRPDKRRLRPRKAKLSMAKSC